MPYYGKLPGYFDFWLSAVKMNDTVDFAIITDLIPNDKVLPANVKLINISFEEFKRKLQVKFDFKISIENLGRISQFRPALAYIFPEVVDGYDYWGFIECDLIPGDIRHFITDKILEKHDKIFKLGHFQIFKNNETMNLLFMQEHKSALSYRFAFTKNILFFEELLGVHNIACAEGVNTYTENVFSDVKASEIYFVRSQYAYPEVPQGIHCLFEHKDGKLYEYSCDGKTMNKREVLYAHFQKREMEVYTNNFENYVIVPNKFIASEKIDVDYIKSVDNELSVVADEYKRKKEKGFKEARKNRYKQICWWQLALIRSRIRNNGGVDLNGR